MIAKTNSPGWMDNWRIEPNERTCENIKQHFVWLETTSVVNWSVENI
ncbi:MAG: hypothetical protein ACKERF_02050 [Candidatus Hodgkinia cicadicola]